MPKQHANNPNLMSPEQAQSLTLLVGSLKGALEGLQSAVERLDEDGREGRRILHEKFESFQQTASAQLTSLGLRVDRVVDEQKRMRETMTSVEPAVTSFREEKLRQEGAKRLGARLWAATVAIAGAVGWGLHEFIGWFKAPH